MYWAFQKQLSELLRLVGEDALAVSADHDFKDLKAESRYLARRGYGTPFSFLLGLGNPIAAVNLHGDEIWAALNISREFVEQLTYKHRYVKKARESQQRGGT